MITRNNEVKDRVWKEIPTTYISPSGQFAPTFPKPKKTTHMTNKVSTRGSCKTARASEKACKAHKKVRPLSRKQLVKKLDEVVSDLVIKRDKKCITCGGTNQPTCGHLFSRRAYSTRWDLLNCHKQCWNCNFKHTFDTYPYLSWFRKTYGQEVLDTLYLRFHTPRKWKMTDLKAMLSDYQNQLERLK